MSTAFIGLDLAKLVFQVHGVDAQSKVLMTKRLRRDAVLALFANLPVCVVGMEACAGSHFWARELTRLGYTVRLMAPQYVKPYVKRQKNDRADAEAICEAVQRPSMRFVAVKTEEQQSTLAIHQVRKTLVAQKTQLINALRAHLAEFGIIAPQGAGKVAQLSAVVADLEDTRVPALARSVLQSLVDQLRDTERRVEDLDARLAEQAQTDEVCQRLMTVPGIGPITATALTATIGDATVFESGRQLAAWLGLVPRQTSSGGKERLDGISKAGDGYLRRMLVNGARTVMRWHGTTSPWLAGLLKRRPVNVAVVALANKLARITWAVMTRGENYRKPAVTAEPATA
ncbi:IS110 family transposase [Skermanella aerolata]|uniref:IS110 family transposase n=1 Tax=Skermanella aerolata TaxID=393310 RepID=A0A512E407_9PROT|nr:IS110 family transposase [Skermanella aerolata]KJB90137.1 transposase IS110 [Skermanella aerolata KACC 11604]GEO43468.1 IS110 family transposase [Skermanella aerolata]